VVSSRPSIARRNIDTYLEMIDAVAADERFASSRAPTVSLKLSSYTTAPLDEDGDASGSREAAFELAERAATRGVGLTIDMESSAWTELTLDVFDALHAAGHRHVGIVLQTRLHRTEADLDRLPAGARVRLVIGIYDEPSEVAITDKAQMKQRLLAYGATLLERGHYVELATHDEPSVRRFVDEVAPAHGAGRDRFEVQMLYGVPRAHLQRSLLDAGVRTRIYVPYAVGWPMAIAYLRRRLDEYPAMMWLVAKNMVRRG
jgi:proline dehydrogenase